MIVAFTVPGPPMPAPRATQFIDAETGKRRAAFVKKRKTGMSYPAYKAHVGRIAQAALSRSGAWDFDGKKGVRVLVYRAAKRGDVDNYEKGCLDSLKGILWPDDRVVMDLHTTMIDGDPRPRLEVEVRCL